MTNHGMNFLTLLVLSSALNANIATVRSEKLLLKVNSGDIEWSQKIFAKSGIVGTFDQLDVNKLLENAPVIITAEDGPQFTLQVYKLGNTIKIKFKIKQIDNSISTYISTILWKEIKIKNIYTYSIELVKLVAVSHEGTISTINKHLFSVSSAVKLSDLSIRKMILCGLVKLSRYPAIGRPSCWDDSEMIVEIES